MDILKDYLEYLKQKNYAEKTIKMYKKNIIAFYRFIIDYKSIEIPIEYISIFILRAVKECDINAYLVYLNNIGNGSITRKHKIITIRGFYKYLNLKYSIDNPVKDIYIQQTHRLPKYLNLKQAKKLIGVFNKSNSRYPERDNLIISILLTTGIRRNELANIDIKNIDFNKKTIKIKCKGNNERIIYLTTRTTMQIKTFLCGSNKRIPLITSNRNKRISNEQINRIVNKAYRICNLSGYSVHSLRHTYASIMYEQNHDILIVKELLGHKNIESTQIYTHLSNDLLKKAVNSNPLSRERSKISE